MKKKAYLPDVYFTNRTNTSRFAVGVSGANPLYVIGLNPSTADDQKSDRTISKIINFAAINGFDGFVMFNLYPQRTPYPKRLPRNATMQLVHQNCRYLKKVLTKTEKIFLLAAWGSSIELRPYLPGCLKLLTKEIKSQNTTWLKIGSLTKNGHPRHPSRASYKEKLQHFDIDAYLANKKIP